MDAKIHHHRHGKNMEQRQHAHHDFFAELSFLEVVVRLLHIGGEIGVGEHGALGPSGGAAGILQHRDILFRVYVDCLGAAVIGAEILE